MRGKHSISKVLHSKNQANQNQNPNRRGKSVVVVDNLDDEVGTFRGLNSEDEGVGYMGTNIALFVAKFH